MKDSTVINILKVVCWGSVAAVVVLGVVLGWGMARTGEEVGVVGEVEEGPYSLAEMVGYKPYRIHTPWGVEKAWMTRQGVGEVRSKAKAQALRIERSAAGTLEQVCSSWSISETTADVERICSELKEELRAEEEEEAEAEGVMERLDALHRAGGPID